MIASSTTTPTAITSPASTIVLIVVPRHVEHEARRRSATAGSRPTLISGAAPLEEERVRMRITRSEPMNRALVRLSIGDLDEGRRPEDRACRPRCPGGPGRARRAPPRRPSVTSSVLAQGSFSTMSISPSPSLMTASPTQRLVVALDDGHVAEPDGAAVLRLPDRDPLEVGCGDDREHVLDADPLVGRLDGPSGADQGAARCTAAGRRRASPRSPSSTCSSVTPLLRSRSGSTWT